MDKLIKEMTRDIIKSFVRPIINKSDKTYSDFLSEISHKKAEKFLKHKKVKITNEKRFTLVMEFLSSDEDIIINIINLSNTKFYIKFINVKSGSITVNKIKKYNHFLFFVNLILDNVNKPNFKENINNFNLLFLEDVNKIDNIMEYCDRQIGENKPYKNYDLLNIKVYGNKVEIPFINEKGKLIKHQLNEAYIQKSEKGILLDKVI